MANTEVAEHFGKLIAKSDYAAAHALLTKKAQKIHSPDGFKQIFEQMTAYAPGPIRQIEVMKDFVLDDWPDKKLGDVASVYVGLVGDSYVEAVTVILAKEAGTIRIRHLEWGRP